VHAKRSPTAGGIDEYLGLVALDVRVALEKLRKIIKTAAPDTVEVISYRIPIFKYRGHPLVRFDAIESHCSFFVMAQT
jgi:uncharacterized protein YdhG (YjbR/CyaY superfamily)